MKLAITADLHFHNFQEFGSTTVEPFSGLPVNSRLLDQLTTFWKMCKDAKARGVKHLLINGDLFHIRGSVPTDVYQFVYMYIDMVVNDLGIQVHILVGNHDQADKAGNIHSVYGLRNIAKVYDVPQWALIGDVPVYFIPYISDKTALSLELDKSQPAALLLAHLGVDGSYVGPVEYKIKDPITLEQLHPDRFHWVLLGHYHKPQSLGEDTLYIGSPAQVNRGEAGESKRWVMYDSDNPNDLKYIPTKAKQFLSMTASEFMRSTGAELDNYIDVHVEPDFTDTDELMKKAHGLCVKVIVAASKDAVKQRIANAQEMTDEELLGAYVEHQDTDPKSHKKLLSLGLQLLQRGAAVTYTNTRLSFLRIVVNNFMVIGKADLKLHNPGSVIAVMAENQSSDGFKSNGGGKSSLLPEALFWCLWGVTARDLPVDKVVNRKRKRDCSVQTLMLAGNRKLDVTRFRKHKILGGDGLRLIIDGVDVTEGTPKLTQERLNKELGVDYITFSSVMAFSPDALRFVNDTDANQKHVLDSILQTRRFSSALDVAKKALSVTRNARLSLSQSVNASTIALGNLQELATKYKELNRSWQQREAERVAGLEEAVAEQIAEQDAQTAVLDKLRESLAELDTAYKRTSEELNAIPEHKDSLLKWTAELATCQADIKNLMSQIDAVNSSLEAAVDQAGKPCPTCGQNVANTGKLIASYQSQRNTMERQLKLLRNKELETKATKDTYLALRDKYNELSDLLDDAKSDTAVKQRSIRAMQDKITATNKIIRNTQNQILAVPVNDYNALIAETDNKYLAEYDNNAKLSAELRKNDLMCERLQFWVTGFGTSGVRSYLLDCVLPTLSEYANNLSNKLSGGNIHINFQTHKEGVATDRFVIQAWNEDGADVYKGNSSGEKRRIDVCVMLALFKIAYNRTRLNILLLDEALDTLDEAGLENVVELLEDLAKELQLTIYVTSHTDLNVRLHESILLRKVGGISTLVK